ncbi:TonB-dependent receptor [Elongatibacter sediminis]|uniref:TonB-dependent receptor n=1 Tax=Elongatibacter sediminis TaxID=3119006 RepID=A0AAW9R692_9GAMM
MKISTNRLLLLIIVTLATNAAAQTETRSEARTATLSGTNPDDGQPENGQEEVQIWGRAIDLVGAADSASQGIVGYDDLATRPLLRVGELVEVIPGMIATQHSGGGKANQYFLRGINLDHGTDFSVSFEGMPVNLRTHAHGQGYLDMNFIIPELVRTVEYHKGTYWSDAGDFSAASSSKFETYDRLDRGFAKLTVGSEEYYRAVAARSWDASGGTWLLGSEIRRGDGPWDNGEDLELFNGFAKYTTETPLGGLEVIATYYTNDWNATDQIPRRAVESGDLSDFGFIDPTVGGETSRFNLIANLSAGQTDWHAYASTYSLNLFANPTYFLNDPVNGDQIEQEDQRWIAGASVDHLRELAGLPLPTELRVGAETRYDRISDVNLYATRARQRLATVRDDSVDEFSAAVYGELSVDFSSKWRATAGVRADWYSWDVTAARPENSGSGTASVVTPKFSLAYRPTGQWELYANYGEGFHSNDVRAAETRVDPVSGNPAEPFDVISEATGYEFGFRSQLSDRLNFSATWFHLALDSELIFVGDAGTTEPNDATERDGIEVTLFWRPTDWLVLDASAAKTDARFKDAPAGEDAIPDAQDMVGAFGATVTLDNGFVGSLRVRHFGDAPLIEDRSVTKDATTLINLGLSYPLGRFVLGLDVLNLFDAEANDIEYFYESRLFGETDPVEDWHFHPVEPREFRLSMKYLF